MRDVGRVLILGAGPTGLGAATRLAEVGYPVVRLVEGRGLVGGLAASHVDRDGFTWDLGGHVHHSHYRRYDELLDAALPGGWIEHERISFVRIGPRWIPFPFQLNLRRLSTQDRDRCLRGLESVAGGPAGRENFAQWIRGTFGRGIAELFMIPYNEKVWGAPLDRLGTSWMADRVARPNLDRIRRSIREGRDEDSWGPNRTFRFPRVGGTGALWSAVAQRLPEGIVEVGFPVVEIDLEQKKARLADERVLEWDRIVSTMPLDRLCSICHGLSPALLRLSRRLLSSSVHVLGVGLRGEPPPDVSRASWLYFPGENSPYYRVTVFSNYSPSHVPEPGCWSLMAEVCETAWRPVDESELRAWTLRAMVEDGLLPVGAEVVSWWHRREQHGYPTPFLGRDELLDTLLPGLERHGVYSRGRFGAWKYEVSNQDHSFIQGVEVADRLLGLGEEVTLHHPDRVNRSS